MVCVYVGVLGKWKSVRSIGRIYIKSQPATVLSALHITRLDLHNRNSASRHAVRSVRGPSDTTRYAAESCYSLPPVQLHFISFQGKQNSLVVVPIHYKAI